MANKKAVGQISLAYSFFVGRVCSVNPWPLRVCLLSFFDTLAPFGSLHRIGTLIFFGSPLSIGTLIDFGSLRFHDTLYLCGHL